LNRSKPLKSKGKKRRRRWQKNKGWKRKKNRKGSRRLLMLNKNVSKTRKQKRLGYSKRKPNDSGYKVRLTLRS
jgi:hypothetical protein